MESGSSVKFTWVIDSMDKIAHDGESYHVMFKKPAEYKLKVSQGFKSSTCSSSFCLKKKKKKNQLNIIYFSFKLLAIFVLGDSFQPCELPKPANAPDC